MADQETLPYAGTDGNRSDHIELVDAPAHPDAGIVTFVARSPNTTVTIQWSAGGASSATLRSAGEVWRVNILGGECYCWTHYGPAVPDCSLRCYVGGTYYVG